MTAESNCLLLAGDTGINRLSVQSALASLGCAIAEADSSNVALHLVASQNFNFILMNDSALSIALYRKIMGHRPHLPVVLLSDNYHSHAASFCSPATLTVLPSFLGDHELQVCIAHVLEKGPLRCEDVVTLLKQELAERNNAIDAFKAIAETSELVDVDQFLRTCAVTLASTYHARYVIIGVLKQPQREVVRTLVLCRDGEIIDNFEYEICGTPCHDALNLNLFLVPTDVQRRYPKDQVLIDLGIDSYFGAPLRSAALGKFGILAVLDSRPMDVSQWTRPLLGTYANRIAAELEKRAAEEEKFHERERAEVTLQSIADGVITADPTGKVQYLNRMAEHFTGLTNDQARGKSLSEIFRAVDELTRETLRELEDDQLLLWSGQKRTLTAVLIGRDQREFTIELSVSPILNRQQEIAGVAVVFQDISQVRVLARALSHRISHDELTGLINRRAFEACLDEALHTARIGGRCHALCYLDLDQFKIINDTCGHVAGDQLLRQLTQWLQTQVRERDIIARLGGDEFGILLADCPLEKAESIAKALRRGMKDFNFEWDAKSFSIGVSIGVVRITANSVSSMDLLKSADSACYAAKDYGRNRVYVSKVEDAVLAKRYGEMEWVQRIQQAIAENRFCLYYQPIITLGMESPLISHCELLVRMYSETGKVIAPGIFLPAAERYNLIAPIDRWVVRAALAALCEESSILRRLHAWTSINLSAQSLCDDDFLGFVVNEISETEVDPELICFEITETAVVNNLSRAVRFISVLKGMGCRFALDDFGKGASSFAYLKNLSVDYIKIDGHFVKDMVNDPIDYAMVNSIKQIGHVMGIRSIAEFVEDDATISALKDMGVDFAQGYGIARPTPINIEIQSSFYPKVLPIAPALIELKR